MEIVGINIFMNKLELAKSLRTDRPNRKYKKITHEDYELAIAWAVGDISVKQIKAALSLKENNNLYSFISAVFREGILTKRLRYFTPLSNKAKSERATDWKPEYMNARQDTIKFLKGKSRSIKSTRRGSE